VDLFEYGRRLMVSINYSSDLFMEISMVLWKERFLALIDQALAQPLVRLSEMDPDARLGMEIAGDVLEFDY
jgi:hypothetical protein